MFADGYLMSSLSKADFLAQETCGRDDVLGLVPQLWRHNMQPDSTQLPDNIDAIASGSADEHG
jgi:hypothetical protein